MIKLICLLLTIFNLCFGEYTIVLIGDSNTHGIPVREGSWAFFLKRDFEKMGAAIRIHNYGIGCATTGQCDQLLDTVLEAHNPDLVIYTAGLVDVLLKHSFDEMKSNMEISIQRCRSRNTLILFGLVDFSCWQEKLNFPQKYLLRANNIYLDIALQYPEIVFNYLDSELLGDPLFNAGDWVHPNEVGNYRIYLTIKEKLLEVLPKHVYLKK
jgi:lysophospholipase L1-like esterase